MNKKAFTLVELIVVITILAILSTIWYISFQWYGLSSRDSVRLNDMKSIEKVLWLYRLTNSISKNINDDFLKLFKNGKIKENLSKVNNPFDINILELSTSKNKKANIKHRIRRLGKV